MAFPPDTGIMGVALGLVGPVSVYCDWVGYMQCYPYIPVWQHIKLVEVAPSLKWPPCVHSDVKPYPATSPNPYGLSWKWERTGVSITWGWNIWSKPEFLKDSKYQDIMQVVLLWFTHNLWKLIPKGCLSFASSCWQCEGRFLSSL